MSHANGNGRELAIRHRQDLIPRTSVLATTNEREKLLPAGIQAGEIQAVIKAEREKTQQILAEARAMFHECEAELELNEDVTLITDGQRQTFSYSSRIRLAKDKGSGW